MKQVIALVLLFTCCSAAFGDEVGKKINEFTARGTSDIRRGELIDELEKMPFERVGPAIVRFDLSLEKSVITYNPITNKPWLETKIPSHVRASFAAAELWRRLLQRQEPGVLAQPLIQLVNASVSTKERTFYLIALRDRHYSPAVIPQLILLADHPQQPWIISLRAAEVLIRNDDINRHFRRFLATCERLPPDEAAGRFCEATNGAPLSRLNPLNREIYLKFAFDLLRRLPGREGYFLARRIGDFLGIENGFAPEQSLPVYQGKNGLTDSFFEDTVKNALRWQESQ